MNSRKGNHFAATSASNSAWVIVGISLCTLGITVPEINLLMRVIGPRIQSNGLPGPRGVVPDVSDVLILLVISAVCLTCGITLIRTGNRRARAAKQLVIRPCPDCGYELAGLDQPRRCPECSYELNPDLIPIPGWGNRPSAASGDVPPSKPA